MSIGYCVPADVFLRKLRSFPGIVGIEIGGSVSKAAFLCQSNPADPHSIDEHDAFFTDCEAFGVTGRVARHLRFDSPLLGGTLHFVRFETYRIQPALEALYRQEHRGKDPPTSSPSDGSADRVIYVTGGGYPSARDTIERLMGFKLELVDELKAIASASRVLIFNGEEHNRHVYRKRLAVNIYEDVNEAVSLTMDCKGILMCGIGSNITVFKLAPNGSELSAERLKSSSNGGLSFITGCRMVTSAQTFAAAMALCLQGDSTAVDQVLMKIYGGCERRVLGKALNKALEDMREMRKSDSPEQLKEADAALCVLTLVCTEAGCLAVDLARQSGSAKIVYFGGFLGDNALAVRLVSLAVAAAAGSPSAALDALFVREAEYFSAIGVVAGSLGRL